MHYELRIDPDTHVRASLREDRSTKCVDYPNNYELCIMNYELIQTRTSVRLYERAGQPNVWITPK